MMTLPLVCRAALMLALLAFSTRGATTVTISAGPQTDLSGAIKLDATAKSVTISGPWAGIASEDIAGVASRPSNEDANYFYVGPDSEVFRIFLFEISYLGFDWGSPDAYNSFTTIDGHGVSVTYGAGGVSIPDLNTDGKTAQYVGFFFDEPISTVIWTSNSPAFEFSEIAVVPASIEAPNPESPTLALSILGILATGAGKLSGKLRRSSRAKLISALRDVLARH